MIYKYGTLKELSDSIDPTMPIYLDTETSKLGSQIRLVQVYQEAWEQVMLFDTTSTSVSTLWYTLQPHHLVLHNGVYDFGCFKEDLPKNTFEMPREWDDTFYLSRLAHPNWNVGKGYSLDAALTCVLGYDPYAKAGLNKHVMQMSFERLMVKGEYVEGPAGLKALTPSQLLYGSIDVFELPKLYKDVESLKGHFVYELDKLTIKHIMTDEKGMPVDLEQLAALEQKDLNIIAANKKALKGMNVNSYNQVRKALGTVISSDEMTLQIVQNRPQGITDLYSRITPTNGKWAKAVVDGINNRTISVEKREFGKATKLTKGSELPTSAKILVYACESSYVHTQEKVEKAKLINETRKALKRLTFVERARRNMNEEHRIRATFSPHAINGRIQQDNENLSQYPRSMKAMWGHPKGNGRKLLYCDFAQIELRIICAALPEMNMYKAFKEGIDIHSFVADNFNFTEEEVAMLPIGQNPRQVAKQANFLLLYGGGATNFQRVVCRNSGVWFDDAMVEAIITKWKDIFSDIKSWHKANSAAKTKAGVTVSGRKYTANIVTDLNNIRVSGTGSEVFKLWLHYIHKYMLPHMEETYIVNRVHDAVYIDLPDRP